MKHHHVENANSTAENAPQTAPPDLIQMVTDMLQAAGHPEPSRWVTHLSPDYATAPDIGHKVFLINRCWRLIIGDFQVRNVLEDTSVARYCLVDTFRVDDWQRSFNQGVVPCAVKHNLPLILS